MHSSYSSIALHIFYRMLTLFLAGFTILLGIAVSSEENSNFISKLENLFYSDSNTDSLPIVPTEMFSSNFSNISYSTSTLNATTIANTG